MVQICAPTSNPDTNFPTEISQHRPYIHVSGVASNSDKPGGFFDLNSLQYISILSHGSNKAIAPISCFIPDSPQFNKGKLVPVNRHYATVEGFLVNAFFDSKGLNILQRFHIEVNSVITLGYNQLVSSAGTESL